MPLRRIGAELKEQASEKVDQAKDKANEVASDAKKKGEGMNSFIYLFQTVSISPLYLEVKNDAQQKGLINIS